MANPKSSSLFHFTHSIDNVKSILKEGFYPHYCQEDTRWLGIDYSAHPMVCFCDIPISRISDHAFFYGNYGIGLTKEWGLRNSLSPLIYSTGSGPVSTFVNHLLDDAVKTESLEEHIPGINDHFQRIVSLTKPLSGNMLVDGEVVEKEFYQECEWRYIPESFISVFNDEFPKNKDELNSSVAKYKLELSPQDIKYIFVKSESEIPDIFDYIQSELGNWPSNDLKLLTSRILSLDTLNMDL